MNKRKVVILATGGTIAGVGATGKTIGYQPGSLTAKDLILDVPELNTVAAIETIQICNVNSDDITDRIWIRLAKTINEMSDDPEIAGFVITHGTDTIEETAYFLNLTVKTRKPVVLTGSMRPSTAISPDGPMNLYESVCVAASDVTAIAAGAMRAIGVVRDGSIYLYESPAKRHIWQSGFDVSALESLPNVSILYFAVDADPAILSYAAEHSDGIVIAGAGAGEFSKAFKGVIKTLSIPVVISSRIDDGIILPGNLLCENTIAADNLPPQKAAILLRLALTKTRDQETIQEWFFTY